MDKKKFIGNQSPTLEVSNTENACFSVYDEIGEFLEKCGIFLFPWQRYILDQWLARSVGGGWAFSNVGLSIPRRNGKSELIIAYILVKTCLYNESTVYTSYHDNSMKAVFSRIRDLISKPSKYGRFLRSFFYLPFKKGNTYTGPGVLTGKGGEAIESKNGGKCVFMTRGGGAGRGQGADNLIFDEAQELTKMNLDTLLPVADGANPQVFYVGTPEPFSSEKKVFSRVRTGMIDGLTADSYWAEWSVEKIGNKNNKVLWYRTNPSLGLVSAGERGGLSESYINTKQMLDDEQFAVEILGYWSRQMVNGLFDIATWENMTSDEPVASNTERLSLGIRFSLDGSRYSVCVASSDVDRKPFVQVLSEGSTEGAVEDFIDSGYGSSVYVDWLDYFNSVIIPIMKSRNCVSVFIDGKPHIDELKILLARHGLWNTNKNNWSKQGKIVFVKPSEIVGVNSLFVESVRKEDFTHDRDEYLAKLIIDAGRREIRTQQGGFGFLSNSGALDMTALESVALALFAIKINDTRTVRKENERIDIRSRNTIGRQRTAFLQSRRSL